MQTKLKSGNSNQALKRWLATLLLLLVVLLAILGLALLISPEFHRLGSEVTLSDQTKHTLMDLGAIAAKDGDVPIAAVILYGDSIIGKGYNTVVRDTNVAGHAEINALSDALARIGPGRFKELHRDSLKLVSTLEPCPMCRGAIMEYRIQHVVFLKGRSFNHWFRQLGKQLKFEWEKEKGADEAIQDSLLREHPGYDSTKIQL